MPWPKLFRKLRGFSSFFVSFVQSNFRQSSILSPAKCFENPIEFSPFRRNTTLLRFDVNKILGGFPAEKISLPTNCSIGSHFAAKLVPTVTFRGCRGCRTAWTLTQWERTHSISNFKFQVSNFKFQNSKFWTSLKNNPKIHCTLT